MSRQEVIVWICDFCSTEDPDAGVKTHSMVIDGEAVEAEACDKCWGKYRGALVTFVHTGRKIKARKLAKAKVPKVEAVPFPGQSWHFTYHALQRMGERRLDPLKVIEAAEKPTVVRAGRTPDSEVRVRGDIFVTLDVTGRRIITAARRDEEVAAS